MRPDARVAFGLVAALLCAGGVRAENDWQPLVTQDGVSVEERDAPGRALPELRATVEIDAGLFEVLAVITDVPRQTEWMHDCEESRLLRKDSAGVSLIYNRTSAPWPVSDRDAVLRTEVVLLAPSAHAALRFANASDPDLPPLDGVVRMPRLSGEYDLIALLPTRTRVDYLLDIDPGGSLPSWAVARMTRNTPLRTLIGLRRQVDETRGRYAEFVSEWSARR